MERYTDKIVMITGAGDVALAIAERMLGEGARDCFHRFFRNGSDCRGE